MYNNERSASAPDCLCGVLIGAAGWSGSYLVRTQREIRELVTARGGAATAFSHARDRPKAVDWKLNALNSTQPVLAPGPARSTGPNGSPN